MCARCGPDASAARRLHQDQPFVPLTRAGGGRRSVYAVGRRGNGSETPAGGSGIDRRVLAHARSRVAGRGWPDRSREPRRSGGTGDGGSTGGRRRGASLPRPRAPTRDEPGTPVCHGCGAREDLRVVLGRRAPGRQLGAGDRTPRPARAGRRLGDGGLAEQHLHLGVEVRRGLHLVLRPEGVDLFSLRGGQVGVHR